LSSAINIDKEDIVKKSEIFSCGKCGHVFEKEKPAEEHEEKCLTLAVGQKVKFLYGLLTCEGRITGLHPPKHLGDLPTVDLETEEEIDEVDQTHDGRHARVGRSEVCEVLSG